MVQLAAFHRLPAVYPVRDFVEVGGLMTYGTNVMEAFRQLGIYAGRMLKGAKPADLPVVQRASSSWSSTLRLPECLASPCRRRSSPTPTR